MATWHLGDNNKYGQWAIGLLVAAQFFVWLLPLSLIAWLVGLVLLMLPNAWTSTLRMAGFFTLGAGFPARLLLAALNPSQLEEAKPIILGATVLFYVLQCWVAVRLIRALGRSPARH